MRRRPSPRRLSVVGAALCAAVLASIYGCGGGGGTTGPDVYPEACGKGAYTPNYADGDALDEMVLRRWRTLPVRVYFDTASRRYTPDVRARAVTAFDGWVSQSGGRLRWVEVDRPGIADIEVRFIGVDDPPLRAINAVGITYTTEFRGGGPAPDRGYLASAEVYVGLDGSVTRENGTMAHEFGHALGIGGHSPSVTDVMYRTGSSRRSPVPTTPDINTLRTAYCDDFTLSDIPPESRAVVPPSRRGPRFGIE